MTVVAAGVVLAGLALFLALPASPSYHRSKAVSFTADMLRSLVPMAQYSVLLIEHDGSDRFMQFRKAEDTGKQEQVVVFGFPRATWSTDYFLRVLETVQGLNAEHEVVTYPPIEPDGEGVEFVEVPFSGHEQEIADSGSRLVAALLPALDLTADARFTFHIAGAPDPMIWRRVNRQLLERMARGRLFVGWWGRRQLRRIAEDE